VKAVGQVELGQWARIPRNELHVMTLTIGVAFVTGSDS